MSHRTPTAAPVRPSVHKTETKDKDTFVDPKVADTDDFAPTGDGFEAPSTIANIRPQGLTLRDIDVKSPTSRFFGALRRGTEKLHAASTGDGFATIEKNVSRGLTEVTAGTAGVLRLTTGGLAGGVVGIAKSLDVRTDGVQRLRLMNKDNGLKAVAQVTGIRQDANGDKIRIDDGTTVQILEANMAHRTRVLFPGEKSVRFGLVFHLQPAQEATTGPMLVIDQDNNAVFEAPAQ